MSDVKFRITSADAKGRLLEAGKSMKCGEVILQESPLVSSQFSWNKAYGYLACEHCMLPLETAQENIRRLAFDATIILPHGDLDPTRNAHQTLVECQECSAKFCSSECSTQANEKYHKLMCQHMKPGQAFDQINEIWKKMHYPPETSSVLLVLRIFAMLKTNPELLASFNEFCSRSVNDDQSLCHKMLGEKFTGQLSTLQQALARFFGDDETLAKYVTLEALTKLFALIGTNQQGIGTSSFAAWVKTVEEQGDVSDLIEALYDKLDDTVGHRFLNNEGSGLYLTQSKINHSCDPNAEVQFVYSNHTLQVVALQDIKEGEEICISYLDQCELSRSRHSRQKYLQENYLFTCSCSKCQEEIGQPDATSDEDEMETDDDE